ncbi:MAG: hypothetical protein ACK5V3_15695 [Bdellovibrionales bacterium]
MKELLSLKSLRWGGFFALALTGLFLGLWFQLKNEEESFTHQQEALIYTESQELATGIEALNFSDWRLKVVVIDEPTEWEIKTLAGHGAHLILINHKRLEKLNQMGLLERAKIRVPLFSFLGTDFRKTDWAQVFLPLFWRNETQELNKIEVWGLSVPQNTPDRQLSWKAFYEIVGHPYFKAQLASTKFGLTLEEFENSIISADRKPSAVRNKKKLNSSTIEKPTN